MTLNMSPTNSIHGLLNIVDLIYVTYTKNTFILTTASAVQLESALYTAFLYSSYCVLVSNWSTN